MKCLMIMLALTLSGMWAHAESMDQMDTDVNVQGKLSWTCGLTFTGTSEGVKVILGHFTTEAVGRLKCIDLEGHHFSKDVRVSMGSHWIGPVVGIGHFKFAGVSSEISLFNCSPNVLFGKYLVGHGQGAIIGGAGTFAAVRVKPPEVAMNISLKLLHGFGAQVGIESMTLSEL